MPESQLTVTLDEDTMTHDVIFPEDMAGKEKEAFQRLMALVPTEDQADVNLKRFLAFRMRIDGETAARSYLLQNIKDAEICGFSGTLYEFLVAQDPSCAGPLTDEAPPDQPG